MATVYLQLIIGGILQGGIYALAAFGLSLIFGVSNILNLAHGEFLMLGAMVSFLVFTGTELSPFVIALGLIPLFFAAGSLFERGLIRPLAGRPEHVRLVASILVTLGASIAIEDFASFTFGPNEKALAYTLPSFEVGPIIVSTIRLTGLAFILVLTLALHAFLKRTYQGRAIVATTQNRRGAMLVGVNIQRVANLSFGIGAILAALAGVFFVIMFPVTPYVGLPLTLKYLCIIVLGGLGSLVGTLLGGLVLGLVEILVAYYSPHWSETSAFIILVLILLIRPQGLFGRISG